MTPSTSLQSWKQLTILYVGGTICLPVILIGQELANRYGTASALLAIMLGNLLLYLLGVVATSIGTRNRRSTAQQAVALFGPSGGRLFATVMALTLLVWFAIQLQVITESLCVLFPLPSSVATLLLGGGITFAARDGLRSITRIAQVSAPLLAGTLAWALVQAPVPEFAVIGQAPGLAGVSLVMATAITMVIDLPTYFRYARSPADSQITNALLFLLALPAIEAIGIYLATALPGHTILETLQGTGGALWQLWIALFLIITGWATNNANLFSAVVSGETVASRLTERQRTYLFGAFATVLACFDILQHMEGILTILGTAISSMGGVMIAAHALGLQSTRLALAAWLLGCAIGTAEMAGMVTLTSIELLDGFLAASLATGLLTTLTKLGRTYEKSTL